MPLNKRLEEAVEATLPSPYPSSVVRTEDEAGHEETAMHERVTAQEFARALASLEARHEQSERSGQDTVPIGEALAQLGLSANAADLFAEVQAQRQEKQAAQQAAQQRAHTQRNQRRLSLALFAALGLGLSGYALVSLSPVPAESQAAAAFVLPPPSVVAAVPVAAPAELKTLAEVGEGQTVLCKSEELQALVQHPTRSLANVVVQTPDSSLLNGRWALAKHEGHVYVQAYMAAMSAQVLAQMKSVDLYSAGVDCTQAGGLAYVKPVCVRLDHFTWKSMGRTANAPYLTVTDLRLDRFAEAAQP